MDDLNAMVLIILGVAALLYALHFVVRGAVRQGIRDALGTGREPGDGALGAAHHRSHSDSTR